MLFLDKETVGFVYLIQDGEFPLVKIGHTQELRARFKRISYSCVGKLHVRYYCKFSNLYYASVLDDFAYSALGGALPDFWGKVKEIRGCEGMEWYPYYPLDAIDILDRWIKQHTPLHGSIPWKKCDLSLDSLAKEKARAKAIRAKQKAKSR